MPIPTIKLRILAPTRVDCRIDSGDIADIRSVSADDIVEVRLDVAHNLFHSNVAELYTESEVATLESVEIEDKPVSKAKSRKR